MPNPEPIRAQRVVFGMEIQGNDADAYVSVIVRGDLNADMADALSDFVVRTRKRLQRRGPLLLGDVWEVTNDVQS